jgi:DNA polymerase-3 subunit epsilon
MLSSRKEGFDMEFDFAAIDFETAQYAPNSACSVGLVKFSGLQPVETYQSLIRPPKLYIRKDFTAIHGLTVDDVREAPRFGDIWEASVLPFIGALPLVAHNAAFDMNVLAASLAHYGCAFPKTKYFCSVQIARKTWSHLRSHALSALGKNFNIAYNAHDALDDARTCGVIVCMAAQKLGALSVRELLRYTGVRMKRVDALKHKYV